jgi:hypothetical protein
LTHEEIESIWYDKAEYEAMKQTMIPLLRAMMRREKIDETSSESETTRGLEYRTRHGALKRQRNKVESITIVLEEQEHQTMNGYINEEQIRHVYVDHSAHCLITARELGVEDELWVDTFVREYSDMPLQLLQSTYTFGNTEESSSLSFSTSERKGSGLSSFLQQIYRKQQSLYYSLIDLEPSSSIPQAT